MQTSESSKMQSNVPSSSSPKTSEADQPQANEVSFLEAPLRTLTPQLTASMTLEQLNQFVTLLRANRSSQTFRSTLTKEAQKEVNAERSAAKVSKSLEEFF